MTDSRHGRKKLVNVPSVPRVPRNVTIFGLKLFAKAATIEEASAMGGAAGFVLGLGEAMAEDPVKRWLIGTQAHFGKGLDCIEAAMAPKNAN